MFHVKTTTRYECSWEKIKAAVDGGAIRAVLHSGDQIPVTLKSGEEITLDVTYDEGGNLFFVMHDCMKEEHCMNRRMTSEGGWPACDMRRYLNENVFPLLPDDLQAVIKPTVITQVIDGKKITCEDRLFLLSRTQVFGKGRWSDREPEDTQLDIFRTERDRVKMCGDNGTWFWWLRSAYGTNGFGNVYGNGNYNSNYANNSGGVALGFSI